MCRLLDIACSTKWTNTHRVFPIGVKLPKICFPGHRAWRPLHDFGTALEAKLSSSLKTVALHLHCICIAFTCSFYFLPMFLLHFPTLGPTWPALALPWLRLCFLRDSSSRSNGPKARLNSWRTASRLMAQSASENWQRWIKNITYYKTFHIFSLLNHISWITQLNRLMMIIQFHSILFLVLCLHPASSLSLWVPRWRYSQGTWVHLSSLSDLTPRTAKPWMPASASTHLWSQANSLYVSFMKFFFGSTNAESQAWRSWSNGKIEIWPQLGTGRNWYNRIGIKNMTSSHSKCISIFSFFFASTALLAEPLKLS